MPSKGVDYYSYIAPSFSAVESIQFYGPAVGTTNTASNNFDPMHLEVDQANVPWYNLTGTFGWQVDGAGGVDLYGIEQGIYPITGLLGEGDFTDLLSTPAVVEDDYIITYGFYDAGSGEAGLTSSDQAWVTVTPNMGDWMGTLAPVGSSAAASPFSTFILPGAHDAGMNTLASVNNVIASAGSAFLSALESVFSDIPGLASLLESQPDNIILDLSITQKESITDMLNIGIRYFDFRPAYLVDQVRPLVSADLDTLYHTHLIVPGIRFDNFLSEVVSFLSANPSEIVVTRIAADGIEDCTIPDADTVTSFATAALAGTGIQLGGEEVFQTGIDTLRSSNTRFVMVQNNPKYDSYTDAAYDTLDVSTIIAAFEGMNTAGQAGNDYTVLQCQGTAEGVTAVLIYAALTANSANSPLMETKALFDASTLPWILTNALNNLQATQNIILLNDFVDGATAYSAYQLSQARFEGATSVLTRRDAMPAIVERRAKKREPTGLLEQARRELSRALSALAETENRRAVLRGAEASPPAEFGRRKVLDAVLREIEGNREVMTGEVERARRNLRVLEDVD